MSLLQEIQKHGLADCEFNRQLIRGNTMKTKIEVETNVFSESVIVNFNQYEHETDEPSHVGGYVRIEKNDEIKQFNVIVFSVDGDVISETRVPYDFISAEDL
jgi:hypothetical protein